MSVPLAEKSFMTLRSQGLPLAGAAFEPLPGFEPESLLKLSSAILILNSKSGFCLPKSAVTVPVVRTPFTSVRRSLSVILLSFQFSFAAPEKCWKRAGTFIFLPRLACMNSGTVTSALRTSPAAVNDCPCCLICVFVTVRLKSLPFRLAVPLASRGTWLPLTAGTAFSKFFAESVNGRFWKRTPSVPENQIMPSIADWASKAPLRLMV